MYGSEVPAYTTLLDVTQEVNSAVLRENPHDGQRLGSIERVSAERHGAVRIGKPAELRELARIFQAMGMHPVGYYDLRQGVGTAVPVVSTAFRPIDPDELAYNPFRVFTSLLVTSDRRFFDADLQRRLETFLAGRRLFPDRLLELADRSIEHNYLDQDDGAELVELATNSLALSHEPMDRTWYDELEAVSPVAADIGGSASTHINHLTPRVLDIDTLHASMGQRGIEMIEEIQGPPAWRGPDVLLRQTSFRALAEARVFRDQDGVVSYGSLRVRFGEVEARGIALTPTGRTLYEQAMGETEVRVGRSDGGRRQDIATQVWSDHFPDSYAELAASGLGVFTFQLRTAGLTTPDTFEADLPSLIRSGHVNVEPIVYEDFLPRSAAGIFQSNLSTVVPTSVGDEPATTADEQWLAGVLDCELHDPDELYRRQQQASIDHIKATLT